MEFMHSLLTRIITSIVAHMQPYTEEIKEPRAKTRVLTTLCMMMCKGQSNSRFSVVICQHYNHYIWRSRHLRNISIEIDKKKLTSVCFKSFGTSNLSVL